MNTETVTSKINKAATVKGIFSEDTNDTIKRLNPLNVTQHQGQLN